MKLMIELDHEHYDALIDHVGKSSREYSILINSIILRSGVSVRMMFACEDHEAILLLRVALRWCPEATTVIERAIKNPQSP
jgi:hypothetical protein